MPTKREFIKGIYNFGIKNDSIIILYDTNGIFSSPRVWITFKFDIKKLIILSKIIVCIK